MRIWHEKLIPILCRQHLLGLWREANGAYKIITENKKGYSNHPAVLEFKKAPLALCDRLYWVRYEMLKRGYNSKPMPSSPVNIVPNEVEQWETLQEQIEILKAKKCDCQLNLIKR